MPTTTSTTTTTSTSVSYSGPNNRRTGPATTPSQTQPSQGQIHHPHTDGVIQTTHDAPRQQDLGHGYGEDPDQHAQHSHFDHVTHWGLPEKQEEILLYLWVIPAWLLEIAAGILGSYYTTTVPSFIGTMSAFFVFSAAAWFQTTVQMIQRASWLRDEGNLKDRRRYLHLAVRLNRQQLPTAFIAFCIFIVAYVRRNDTNNVTNWLLFLLVFIFNTVASVMNAYNNITWEIDRLEYEEGSSPYGNTLLAILGIPTKPGKDSTYEQ